MSRIQVVLSEEEREEFRRRADAEGLSLSAWLRLAGRERLERSGPRPFESADDLRRFFATCDEHERGRGREPDWEEHLKVIERSRATGAANS